MRQTKSYIWQVERVANFIELLLSCHPQGIGILLGNFPPPESKIIHEMYNSKLVRMPDDFKPTQRSNMTEAEQIVYDREYFDESVKIAGGWENITNICKEYKKSMPRYWRIVIEHIKYVSGSAERFMSKLEYVAARNGISSNTVMKYRREFPEKLATFLLISACDYNVD